MIKKDESKKIKMKKELEESVRGRGKKEAMRRVRLEENSAIKYSARINIPL